jgi:hypothetical protein
VGIKRIIADFDIRRLGEIIRGWLAQTLRRFDEIIGERGAQTRDWWRGWTESDIDRLTLKLDDPTYYNGGIFKITVREHRAWQVLNRRLLAQNPRLTRSPVLAWAEGKGLFQMVRFIELPRMH